MEAPLNADLFGSFWFPIQTPAPPSVTAEKVANESVEANTRPFVRTVSPSGSVFDLFADVVPTPKPTSRIHSMEYSSRDDNIFITEKEIESKSKLAVQSRDATTDLVPIVPEVLCHRDNLIGKKGTSPTLLFLETLKQLRLTNFRDVAAALDAGRAVLVYVNSDTVYTAYLQAQCEVKNIPLIYVYRDDPHRADFVKLCDVGAIVKPTNEFLTSRQVWSQQPQYAPSRKSVAVFL